MDGEVVCPKPAIEKKCHSKCEKHWKEYQACADRISKKGEGTCEPWYFDYWKCVDACAAKDIFAKLK